MISFEPILALNGGLKGLSEIRKVINKASKLIKTRGKLVLEIAFNQKGCFSLRLGGKTIRT